MKNVKLLMIFLMKLVEMFELRPLKPVDILEIKDNLIEGRGEWLTPDIIDSITVFGIAYSYLKEGKVVACCGAIKTDDTRYIGWHIWALYSKNFSCFTRARAAIAFKSKLGEIGGLARIGVPSDLPNGKKYAKFLGGRFLTTEVSRLFAGIANDIYEIA